MLTTWNTMVGQAAIVGVGGFFGAIARFAVNEGVKRLLDSSPLSVFPFWTMAANVSGAFVMTLFMASLAARHAWCTPTMHLMFVTGFCGAYTTFSTLAYETDRLYAHGHAWLAVANMGGTVVAGLLAVRLAMAVVK